MCFPERFGMVANHLQWVLPSRQVQLDPNLLGVPFELQNLLHTELLACTCVVRRTTSAKFAYNLANTVRTVPRRLLRQRCEQLEGCCSRDEEEEDEHDCCVPSDSVWLSALSHDRMRSVETVARHRSIFSVACPRVGSLTLSISQSISSSE